MKTFSLKRIILAALVAFYSVCVFAQTEFNQMVIPKRIFVGDTAELHYIFRSNVDFFKDEEIDEKLLNLDSFPYSVDNEDFTIKKAVIQRNGPMYTVVITFVPWRPGKIDFEEFDLLLAVLGTKNSVPFLIDPVYVEVSSVLVKGEDTPLRSVVPPLLAPGTIYFIYASILLLIVVVILVIILFAKRHQIALNYKKQRTLRNYARNARRALKQFKKLEKNQEKLTDESFCFAVQQIFRVYLTERFGINFSTLATGQFLKKLSEATGDFFSDEKLEQVEVLHSIFIRSDYIRFAHDGSLHRGERADLVTKSKNVIHVLEAQEGERNA
ncbi:MAG: hypothetical protein IIT58_04525 [Treponema sp.]|nr:hypothetical protein [Treponema sp.]